VPGAFRSVSAQIKRDGKNYRPRLNKLLRVQKNYALVTAPDLRQRAHTLTVFDVPFTFAFIFLIFGFQGLFVLLTEWETLCPNVTPLPQTSHFAIDINLPFIIFSRTVYIPTVPRINQS
jgi:hypothetical protein